LIVILIICLNIWGCPSKPKPPEKPELTPEQAAEARRTIVNWLECEECTEGELEAVVRLGELAVPSLSASLLGGPSQASLEILRRHLVTTYQDLKEYEKTHPEAKVPTSEDEYVKIYLDNYVALYQIRAAKALAAIGGSEAKKALKESQQLPLRDDVKAVVVDSLGMQP